MQRNGQLVVESLIMSGATFLGWDPSDLLGRFVTLKPEPMIFRNQAVAIRLAATLAHCGLPHSEETEMVRTPNGLVWSNILRRIRLAPDGGLGGVDTLYIPTTSPASSGD